MEIGLFLSLGLISAWCLALWLIIKDYQPCVDDIVMRDKSRGQVGNTIVSRLYGAGTVNSLQGDHAISMGLHWLMSCIVAMAVNPVAGLMFAVHPTTMQVSTWMNGKRYAVNGIISMIIYASPIGVVLYPLVFLFQPSGIPAILLANPSWIVVGLLFLPFTYRNILDRLNSRKKETDGSEFQRLHPKKIIFAVKSLWVYFRQSVLPEKNVMYYEDYYGVNFGKEEIKRMYTLDFSFWSGIVAIVFMALTFQQGWWLWMMFIFQWLNFKTYTQTFADRYAYIALVGACWYLASTPLALLLIGFYIARSIENTQQYKGIIQFLKYNYDRAPENPQGASFLISSWLADGRFNTDAFSMARDSYIKHPKSCVLCFLLGKCLVKMGNVDAGIGYMERSKTMTYDCRPEMKDDIQRAIDKARE